MTATSKYGALELRRAQRRLEAMADAQLEIARGQAEGWRNFLTVATGLLAAVLVLKGRENVAELPPGYRLSVILLLSAGLVLLLTAAFLAVSAVHGKPGAVLKYAHAEKLLDWERDERDRIAGLINVTRWATLLGVAATASGIMVTWVAPGPSEPTPSVMVHTRGKAVCGELLGTDSTGVTIRVKAGAGPGGKSTGGKNENGAVVIRHLAWQRDAVSVAPTPKC
jgi:NADH:ubiquinone oxidoreductase subunit 6 (subunit J)